MVNSGKYTVSSLLDNGFDFDSAFAPILDPSAFYAFGDTSSASGARAVASGDTYVISGLARVSGKGGATTITTTTTSSTPSVLTSQLTVSPFVINIAWDSTVASAPAGFMSAVLAEVQHLESLFADPVTINIQVGYGAVAGSVLPGGAVGGSGASNVAVSYSSLVAALRADAKTTTDASVLASLPATSPVSGTVYVSTAEAKALGLIAAGGTSIDGYAAFSSSLTFTYNDTGGVAAGTYDFTAAVQHEFGEILGRTMLNGYNGNNMFYDLLHYSAPGVRDFSGSTPGYFSPDGGVTNDGALNTVSGGDTGDWASSMGNDSFNAFASPGVVCSLSSFDLTLLDALGWDPTGSVAPPPPPSPPTGVAVSALAKTIANALAAAAPLATIVQTGGTSGDSYSYTLGGAGAGAFTLSTANNIAQLSSGVAGLAGSTTGTLYALTVTTNDLTLGVSSPATAVDVIVGTDGSDTISVSAVLAGQAPSTPSFIYGRGANDTLDGSGMSGKLWFVGSGGADRMTGGSGVNDYLYAATSDSTASAMDIITNFHAGTDTIDLTGLGSALSFVGPIKAAGKGANILAAHSAGWQASGGNTFVYVNTSGSSESLSGTNMKIELLGSVSLTSSNILHQ